MFSPPYDWQTILAKRTSGDMAALVLVDSRDAAAHDEARQAILPALIHLGVPYIVRDLARAPLAAGEAHACRAVLLAQVGVSRALSSDGEAALLAALHAGTGLVSFDPLLPAAAPGLAIALGVGEAGSERACSGVVAAANDHFITHSRVAGQGLPLIRAVPHVPVTSAVGARPLLAGEDGAAALLIGSHGAGRWAHWCLSPRVWLNEHLGHANGLDDVFWRSLVWAARKPFVMKAMPPFVTVRIDDAQGLGGLWWNVQVGLTRNPPRLPEPIARMLCGVEPGKDCATYHFQYVDTFNKHGIIPAVGIYIDQVGAEDRPILKRYYDAGKAEFSVHAFSEYHSYDPLPPSIYRDDEERRVTEFLYHRGWHREPGKEGPPRKPDGAYVIDEYSAEELAQNFQRADRFWAETGIRPSRVVNSHYVNPGANSLPFLKQRGQDMMMFTAPFGQMYESHYKAAWSRAPYGSIGLVFDYMPVPEGIPGVQSGDFFCAEAHVYNAHQLAATGHIDDGNIDFTVGSTMKGISRDDNDLQAAADNIVHQVRVGLDSMFFGCMMAHEQGLAVLTVSELDEILTQTDRALSRYDMLFASYEHIAEYAKCKVDSHIERLDERPGGIACRLSGRTTLPLQLYLWQDDGERCRYAFLEVPPFSGGLSLTI